MDGVGHTGEMLMSGAVLDTVLKGDDRHAPIMP
jgi:hypothetical protein